MLVKKIVSAGLLAIAILMVGVVVAPTLHAQATPTAAQCTAAQTRLATRITKVEAATTTQSKVYSDLQARVDALNSSATDAGYEVEGLADFTAAQTTLSNKIVAYVTASIAYSTALTAAKDTACSATNAEFRAAVIAARTALTTFRTASAEVRSTFRTEVIPVLKDYAAWLKEQAITEEN